MNKVSASSFFSKCSKFKLDLKYAENHSENGFCFWDNCIRIGCVILYLLRREYLLMALNVLRNRFKIFHITNRGYLVLNILPIDQRKWYRFCGFDFNSVETRLPCSFWKGNLKWDFLRIYLTPFFADRSPTNK